MYILYDIITIHDIFTCIQYKLIFCGNTHERIHRQEHVLVYFV